MLAALAAAGILGAAPVSAGAGGYVHRQGTQLLDGDGRPLYMVGANLGGTYLAEMWIWGGGYAGETRSYDNLAAIVGRPEQVAFRDRVYAEYISAADLRAARAKGFTAVRIPINSRMLVEGWDPVTGSPQLRTGGMAALERIVRDAATAGLGSIIDLHAAPTPQSLGFIADATLGDKDLWNTANAYGTAWDRTAQVWKMIAGQFRDNTSVWGYDLLNEPYAIGGDRPQMLQDLYVRLIRAVRAVDDRHTIWLGGNLADRDLTGLRATAAADTTGNTGYTVHQYWADPTKRDPAGDLQSWATTARRDGFPLFVGEYGIAGASALRTQVDAYNAQPIIVGRAMWTLKAADTTDAGAFSYSLPAPGPFQTNPWLKLVRYISNPNGTPPTKAQAEDGITKFFMQAATATTRTQPADEAARMKEYVRRP